MTKMNQHFKLTNQEFYENSLLFNTLEIREEQVVDKNYQYLSEYLKKQYKKLIFVNHPDKGENDSRFHQILKAYRELKKYIEPLKSGNRCVSVSIDGESNGRLSEREFHYRNKLFAKLNITKEEVVQKTFEEIVTILRRRDSEFFKNFMIYEIFRSLRQYSPQPVVQLFNYITPLQDKRNLILADKEALSMKFIEHKKNLSLISYVSTLPLALLNTVTICGYLSCWIIAFNIVINIVINKIMSNYKTKYRNSEISTDEFISKIQYIVLGSKFLLNYPLAAFSVYLLATNFIANGLTTGGIILGPLVALAIVIEVLAPIFYKGCEIYIEKHIRDLREEDSR